MPKRKLDGIDIDHELEELNANLKQVETSAVDGEAYELPSIIGININDFGELSLPLKDPQASDLIKRCQQCPFGKDSKKCLDTNVRDSYQLEPSQFKINHPDWDKKLQELVTRVALKFESEAKVTAKLYKLLVYKQGGHFLRHKDTEKEKRMFATLIIQLPSVYSGGELIVYDQNGDQAKKIDFGQSTGKSQYSMHFAAHYADLDHELLEVKSGYRLALVYSICWVTGTLGIILDHYYTEQSLSDSGIGALKGIDNARYSVLAQANNFLPSERQLVFYICQANLSIHYHNYSLGSDVRNYEEESDPDSDSGTEPEYWEKGQEYFQLADWHDINGNQIRSDISYIRKALKEKEFFINVLNPSKGLIGLDGLETWGKAAKIRKGYLGNEPAEKEYEYKKYMLVLFPRNRFETMIAVDFGGAIDSIYRTIIEEKQATDSKMRSKLEKICSVLCIKEYVFLRRKLRRKLCYRYVLAKQLSATSFSQIFQLLTVFNMQKEFKSIIYKFTIKINQECAKRLGLAISQFGFDSLKKPLEKFLKPSVGNFINICVLVQMIYDDNQTDVALNMFVNFLLPLITNPKKCDKIMKKAFQHMSSPYKKFEFDDSCLSDNLTKLLERIPLLASYSEDLEKLKLFFSQ